MRWIFLTIFLATTGLHAVEKSIDVSTSGPVLIVAGSANKAIKVQCVFLTANEAASFYFSSTTPLTGPIPLQAYGCFFTPYYAGFNWFTLYRGENLYLTQSGTARLSGRIYYTQDLYAP